MGMALLHEDGEDMDTLLQAADERMYAAKRESKSHAGSNVQFLEPVEP